MREYVREQSPELPELQANSTWETEARIADWGDRAADWSSPTKNRYKSDIKDARQKLARASLMEIELKVLQQRVSDQEKAKLTSRKSLQTGGPLLAADAIRMKHKRLQKERFEAIKKAQKALDYQLRKAKNEYHKAGVAARRTNRERRKQAE
jgi:hypothetical protein